MGGDNLSDKQTLNDMSVSELEELTKKIDIKVREIDEKIKEVQHDIKVMENEIDLLNKRKESADFSDIKRIDDWIKEIRRQIDSCKYEYNLLNHEKDLQISKKDEAEKVLKDLQDKRYSGLKNSAVGIAKKVITAPVSATVRTVKNTVKSTFSKVNPFDKKVNKNDVSDTGSESIRLAYTSIKKGKNSIKTVSNSIKTTQRTIKTTGTAIKRTGTFVYKTTAFTVKSTIAVAKFVGDIIVHIAATLTSPLIIFLVFIVVFLLIISSLIVLFMGVGTSGANSNAKAFSSALGLGDVSSQYQAGLEFLNTSLENHKNDFNSLIDSMYFDYDDLTNSNLVYMERTDESGGKAIYEKSFATNDRKNSLKSEWNVPLTEREFLAIAYVWLENEKNTSNHSEHGIYEVSYNQEVFDTIVEKCIVYTNTVYDGQNCPDENCTRHVEYVDNPDYYYALDRVNEAADNYNNSGGDEYWGQEYEYWVSVLDSTPSTIEEVTYICEYQHNLHSIGLAMFDKETVMNALNFDDISKQWVELTEKGFENNPDIS